MRILGGKFKGRDLPTRAGDGCRPAMAKVREALFNMLSARGLAMEGLRVMDVFAGTGSLGFECLSRGAAHVRFVEANKVLAKRIADNAKLLGLGPKFFSALPADALKLLAREAGESFDLVFIDPPYGRDLLVPVLELVVAKRWVAPGGFVVVEVEKDLNLQAWPDALELETDRLYGQTRILIWTLAEHTQPFTPAPSIP